MSVFKADGATVILLVLLNVSCGTRYVGSAVPLGGAESKQALGDSITDEEWNRRYRSVHEEWFNYMAVRKNGLAVFHDPTLHKLPEAREIIERYLYAVNDKWIQRGEFRFVVVDEQERPVEGAVRLTRTLARIGTDLEPRFRVVQQQIVGEQVVKWPKSFFEMEIRHPGMRWVKVVLPGESKRRRLDGANRMLQSGNIFARVLPPLTKDGPVRIVMPHREWWPQGIKDDWRGFIRIPDKLFEQPLPEGLAVIVTSEDPGFAPAPKRGLYAVIDKDRKVVSRYACDRGGRLGGGPTGGPGRGSARAGDTWVFAQLGGEMTFPQSRAPYQVVLWMEPKLRPPDSVVAEYRFRHGGTPHVGWNEYPLLPPTTSE